MASNSLGQIFKITTWGESHGKAIGVVIDGCPAGLPLEKEDINNALYQRAPGKTPYTSPRPETDEAEIYSGVFKGVTTGAPLSIIIHNKAADSRHYEPIKHLLRPGHANYTYTQKYGVFDYRGGGRASARETACRVAAGAVAQKLLDQQSIRVLSYISAIGGVVSDIKYWDKAVSNSTILKSPIFCPHDAVAEKMKQALMQAKAEGNSLGGVVSFVVQNMPAGLGDPVYEKLEANIAKGMLSLPATKGFEIGLGFQASSMTGSQHNDLFQACFVEEGKEPTKTNWAGGTLGGLSTGMPLYGRVAFKPTSSIKKPQETVDYQGKKAEFILPEGSRHDPCVAIRAVPVVKAMCQLIVADALLMNRCVRASL